jgi:hypothetical protein
MLGDRQVREGSRAPAVAVTSRARRWLPHLGVWAALALATLLWIGSVDDVDVRQITDLGLVSQAPPGMLVSLALIALGFALSLRLQRPSTTAMLAATLLVIGTVHGLPAFVEDAPRFPTAYLHAGFTDTIAQGNLLTRVDARFSWPLFFSFGALVTQVAGVANAIDLLRWAPLVNNLLFLGPLLVIFSAITTDRRLVWTAVFFFFAANWIGQDYYAPQAFNYLLYLTILAIILRWFRRPTVPGWIQATAGWLDRRFPVLREPMRSDASPGPVPIVSATPRQRVGLLGVLVLLTVVSVASHQLTPFAILGAVTALTLLKRTQLPGLPVLVAVCIGLWISYMTVAYLAGHLVGLLNDIAAPAEAASANVTRRLSGSPGHVFIVQFRLVMTLGFWLLAALGAVRRFRFGNLDLEALALAAVPFGLLALQSYGGEMLLRIYFFSLPFMAFMAAGLFFPSSARPPSWGTTRWLAVVGALMLVALLVAKHGNERAESISADELAMVNRLYATAPSQSVLAVVNTWGAVRYTDFADYRYAVGAEGFLSEDIAELEAELDRRAECTYLFVSRSQQASAELFWGIPESDWQRAMRVVMQSGRFEELYANIDARILLQTPAPAICRGG